jgi:hypothetical protein
VLCEQLFQENSIRSREWLAEANRHAEDFVFDNWTRVLALVAALLEHEDLSGEHASCILRESA